MTNLIIADRDKQELIMLERILAEMGGLEIKKAATADKLYKLLNSDPQILILRYDFLISESFSTAALVKELLNTYPNLSIIVSDNKFDSSKYFNLYASGVTSCLNFNRIDCYKELQLSIKEIKQQHILQSLN